MVSVRIALSLFCLLFASFTLADLSSATPAEIAFEQGMSARYYNQDMGLSPVTLFNTSANFGYGPAQRELGIYYELQGKNFPKALLYYSFAARAGDLEAQTILADKMLFGKNIDFDCQKAAVWYRNAAAAVIEDYFFSSYLSLQEIAYHLDEPREEGLEHQAEFYQLHEYLASTGDVNAQHYLGIFKTIGLYDQEVDLEEARKHFESAAGQGSAASMIYLGIFYEKGLGVPQDSQKAFWYYSKAAEKKSVSAYVALGRWHLTQGTREHDELAIKQFQAAHNERSVAAAYYLGLMTSPGHNFKAKQSHSLAYSYMSLAAEQKYPPAVFSFANMLLNSNAPGYCLAATKLLKQVAEMDSSLLKKAEKAFDQGEYKTALTFYEKAALMGYEIGQYNAAWMYERGIGCSEMSETERAANAFRLYAQSADQGNSKALVKIGDFYFYGKGEQVNYELAAQYYKDAANIANPQAYFNLGYIYQYGIGIPQDIFLSKRYYDLCLSTEPSAFIAVYLSLLYLLPSFIGYYAQNEYFELDTLAIFVVSFLLILALEQKRRLKK